MSNSKAITSTILLKNTPEILAVLNKLHNPKGVLMLTNTWKTLLSQYYPLSSSPHKLVYLAKRFYQLFSNASQIYVPVHAILFLIRWRKFRSNPTLSTYKAIRGWVKSCLFAAFFALSIPFCGVYLCQMMGGPVNSWHGFGVSFTFSWFILFESSSRWGEMSIWVLAQWFEAMIISSKKNKYYVDIPGFSKFAFALAMGIISHCYYDNGVISKKFQFVLRYILGTRNPFKTLKPIDSIP